MLFNTALLVLILVGAGGGCGRQPLLATPAAGNTVNPAAVSETAPPTSGPTHAPVEIVSPPARPTSTAGVTVAFSSTPHPTEAPATAAPISGQTAARTEDRAGATAPVEAAVSPAATVEITPHPDPITSTPTATVPTPAPAIAAEADGLNRAPLPLRLTIPALGVDAPIVAVGLDAVGNMAAPSTAGEAGWYKLGPRPGEPSNAIIAGHVDWLGQDGVFALLHTLQPGELIEVHSQDGFNVQYVVESLRAYQNETAPVAEIFGGTTEPILTLITCTGPYNTQAAEYRDRLVVRAREVSD